MLRRIVSIMLVGLWLSHQLSALQAQGAPPVKDPQSAHWTIVLHGGAGADPDRWSEAMKQDRLEGLRSALQAGVARIQQGAEAMDVVETVVRVLEDHPGFNAGRGAVLNESGDAVLDASIMDGRDRSSGAIAGVRTIRNPITAARRVISDTRHVLLIGDGADQFARSIGLEQVEPEYFKTPEQIEKWQQWKARQEDQRKTSRHPLAVDDPLFYLGTVGCVVLDANGNLAAGTSTGGLLGKQFGRVGDSPIIGAGTFADNKTCAISCTGTGEYYIRNVIAATIAAKMEYANMPLTRAADEAIHQILPEDSGGLIAVDRQGNVAMPFNTPGMARGVADSRGRMEVGLGKAMSQ
jgi:beta-aspartyl-peptidase (threonine type)